MDLSLKPLEMTQSDFAEPHDIIPEVSNMTDLKPNETISNIVKPGESSTHFGQPVQEQQIQEPMPERDD